MKKYLLLLAVTIIAACTHQVGLPGKGDNTNMNGNGSDSTGSSSLICFQGEVLPIFQSSCAKSGCHDAASRQEGYVLDNYDDILKKGIVPGNPGESELYKVITDGEMPPKGSPALTAGQVTLIRQWITEGAQNTANCSTCDTSVFSFTAAIQPIMQTNCVGCHSGSLLSGGVDLSTYNGVKTVAVDGRLYGAITHASGYVPMPQNAAMLSDCNISQIARWIAAGAPNN